MIIKNYSYPPQNLNPLITKLNHDTHILTLTSTHHKNLLIISQSHYNSIIETLYLQHNPNNPQHLPQSIPHLQPPKTITKHIHL
ncbi:type II toxin-antitoxin system Phd/YefM family antitoxin [Staphylococcus aureus]|uniref:type II toxin-antitoxin system Phd/YefM family antitoxin n=1 Tax=Staphylococcus aureus TaxID=1280 RepID=UPI0011A1D1C3|nr:type II toxin-antitoxin system Phd/YefM family antitoxin [Staphylococcus aureus]